MKSAIQTVTLAQPHGREVHNSQIRSRIPPQRGERKLAGGERSEPPGRRGTTIRTPAGVAGPPRAPAAAGAHSFIAIFLGFGFAHPRLSSPRPSRAVTRSFNCTRTLLEKPVSIDRGNHF